MSDLTITHYINKKLKPYFTGIENIYPVYVRILKGREVLRIKSPLISGNKIFSYFTENDLINDIELQKTIINETKLIKFVLNNVDLIEKQNNEVINILNQNICNEILNIDLSITYFEQYKIKDPNFFNVLKSYLSKYLSKNTNINEVFFYNNIIINNSADYEKLTNISFIEDPIIYEIFNIVVQLREFEKKFYTTPINTISPYTSEKPLNIYEWYFNNGKINFINFVDDKIKRSEHFKKIIDSIDFNCKIRLFDND